MWWPCSLKNQNLDLLQSVDDGRELQGCGLGSSVSNCCKLSFPLIWLVSWCCAGHMRHDRDIVVSPLLSFEPNIKSLILFWSTLKSLMVIFSFPSSFEAHHLYYSPRWYSVVLRFDSIFVHFPIRAVSTEVVPTLSLNIIICSFNSRELSSRSSPIFTLLLSLP